MILRILCLLVAIAQRETTGNLLTLGRSNAKKFLTSQIIIQSLAENYQPRAASSDEHKSLISD